MSKRKVGDWVWLKPNAGFVGDSHLAIAQIQDDGNAPCPLCDDENCVEWSTLHTECDADGQRSMLCHVSECEMFDEPQEVKP